MPPAVAALVFDLGNVLIDVDFFRCARRWGALAGIDPRQLAARFRVDRHYEAHERGEIDHRQYFAVLRRQLALDLADEAMAEGWNAIIGEALPGLAGALAEAGRALPCFVLTNTNRLHETEWGPRHRELLAPVAGIFSSWRLGCRKPEKAIFELMMTRIGHAPERIQFLDDGAENVAGAAACGLQTVLVRSPADTLAAIRRALEACRTPAAGPPHRERPT
jgi:putative hydrolase of the HAD superfamily